MIKYTLVVIFLFLLVMLIDSYSLETLAKKYEYSFSAISAIATVGAIIVSLWIANRDKTRSMNGSIEYWNKTNEHGETSPGFLLAKVVNYSFHPIYLDQNVLYLKLPFRRKYHKFSFYNHYESIEIPSFKEAHFGTKDVGEFLSFLQTHYAGTRFLRDWSFKNSVFYCESVDGLKGKLIPSKNLHESLAVLKS